jgi:hypothetical protein
MDHPDYQDYVGKEQGEKDMWQQVRHTASLRALVAHALKAAVGSSRGSMRCGSRRIILPL